MTIKGRHYVRRKPDIMSPVANFWLYTCTFVTDTYSDSQSLN